MVHHYLEDALVSESPNSVVTTSEHVQYNCQIEPPFRETAAEILPPLPEEPEEPPPKPKPSKATCCPLPPPPSMSSSDLVDALPTILVGIGMAYAVGMLTGAFIFSPAVE